MRARNKKNKRIALISYQLFYSGPWMHELAHGVGDDSEICVSGGVWLIPYDHSGHNSEFLVMLKQIGAQISDGSVRAGV